MNTLNKSRIQELMNIGTVETKKGDWILNEKTQIPNKAGITLRVQYEKEEHKESLFGKKYYYIVQWNTVTCEYRKNGEAMTGSGKYIQAYFAFQNIEDRDELFDYITAN